MNTTTKVVLGMAIAAAAGAAVGILVAPAKGDDIRKKIKEGANEFLDEFGELIKTGKEIITQFSAKTARPLSGVRTGPAELTDMEAYHQ